MKSYIDYAITHYETQPLIFTAIAIAKHGLSYPPLDNLNYINLYRRFKIGQHPHRLAFEDVVFTNKIPESVQEYYQALLGLPTGVTPL